MACNWLTLNAFIFTYCLCQGPSRPQVPVLSVCGALRDLNQQKVERVVFVTLH